jgi:hypothetical protein
MTLPIPTEEAEQIDVVRYLELKGCMFTAIPNESRSSSRNAMIRGARMKRQGVRRGFPDLVIITPGHKFFCIEMKRTKGSTTSPEQKQWIEALNLANIPAFVCRGFDEAKVIIDQFLTS